MNLTTYSPVTIPSTKGGNNGVKIAQISLAQKNGRIALSGPAAELLLVTKGDQVIFHQNEDDPTQWYIEKNEPGFILRKKIEREKTLYFNKSVLVKKIFDSMDYKNKTGIVKVMPEPIKLTKNRTCYQLYTDSLRN